MWRSMVTVWALCAGLILVGGWLGGCSTQQATVADGPRPVLVVKAEARNPEPERRFPGRISAVGEVRLGFEVGGQIRSLLVKPGDRVAAGQPLAMLDEERFAIAIAQAESSVAGAQAAADEAEAAFTRSQDLMARQAIAQAAFDRAQAAVDAARAQLRGAQAGLDQARKNLRDATLLAPYDGLIAERLIEDFSQVQAKQAVFVLQAYDRLRVSIQVPESYVLGLSGDRQRRRNQPPDAIVQFLGHPDASYRATFDEVVTTSAAQTLSWTLRFVMPVPEDLTVLPGMSCMVRLVGVGQPLADAGTWVPLSSVVQNGEGQPALWVVDDQQRVQRRDVRLGPIFNGEVAILEGLSAGQSVVRAGHSFLVEGMSVQPQWAARP